MREEKFHIYLNDDEYSRVIQTLIRLIENDFDISLELHENYTGITTVNILCNLIEIEIYSKW